MKKDKPIILAITAASGIIYGIRTLEFLLKNGFRIEVVIASKAYYIAKQELEIDLRHNRETIHKNILSFLNLEKEGGNLQIWLDDEVWANPSSGSYKIGGMIIAPASMAVISAISSGLAENLITRTADVCLKEKKCLTIVPRETPLNFIHLENMLKLSKLGVNIVPPIHGFYANIKTIDDSINFVVGKILDASNIDNDLYERWHV